MTLNYRIALPADAQACVDLRGRTRENAFSVAQLAAIGVTLASWRAGIADGSMPGHVCLSGDSLVGYVFGDKGTGEVIVLALLPEWEGQGIGRSLLDKLVADFTQLGLERLFLGCTADASRRSHGFYRHLGWRSTGRFDAAQDEVLEFFPRITRHATGRFNVAMKPQASAEVAGAASLGRMSLDKQFSGDLLATGQGEMLTAMTPTNGSAGYVAIERVTGTLQIVEGAHLYDFAYTLPT